MNEELAKAIHSHLVVDDPLNPIINALLEPGTERYNPQFAVQLLTVSMLSAIQITLEENA